MTQVGRDYLFVGIPFGLHGSEALIKGKSDSGGTLVFTCLISSENTWP